MPIDLPTAQLGYWRVVWRRFKHHRVAYVGFFFFVLLLVAVIAGPYMAPYELDQVSLSERMQCRPQSIGWARMSWGGIPGCASCMAAEFRSRSA